MGPRRPSQYCVERWLWYQNVPAWSAAVKSYKNELPVEMGHWLTKAGPSAQFVPFWKNPCQCYGERQHSFDGERKDIDTYHSGRLEHRTVGELVDHINLEVITLQENSEVSIGSNGGVHSTNLDARNERAGKLPIYHHSSTGEAIRGDVRVRDGQICDRANGGAYARNGEAQGKKYCDLCTHAHGGKERRGCQCMERKARKTRGR